MSSGQLPTLNPSQTYTATALRPLRDWQFSPIAEVATRSPIGPGEVAEKSATSREPRCDQISRSQVFEHAQKPGCDWFGRPVGNQSPTSRRPTAKPSCDSSATSAIVMNFGRGEVAERLQYMSDWGFSEKQRSRQSQREFHSWQCNVYLPLCTRGKREKNSQMWIISIATVMTTAITRVPLCLTSQWLCDNFSCPSAWYM